MSVTLHLIGNAHLDPVWLWDWREGLNEGISTCRAMVDLLDEFPEATFIRGESAIYEYIERHDVALFADIRRLVEAGRWDIVGGTYIQPDQNLPATEPLLRQFVRAKTWFREKFGREVTAAWATDAFGHSAGMPEILRAAGIDAFACTRPWPETLRIGKSAFWWRGDSGARILAYRPRFGWYGTNRDETPRRLDAALAEAEATGMANIGCFLGLGDHGGGPSRRMLREVRAWAKAHPEARVEFSGLHRFFAALRAEAAARGAGWLPEVRGELNFCLRGCSVSMARFKFAYRRAQAGLLRAERSAAAALALGAVAEKGAASAEALAPAWDGLLFNAFHDILPGSSIERAYDDQFAQLGACLATARHVETAALLDLAARIDTTAPRWPVADDAPLPVPMLVWNPHPWAIRRHVELEAGLDYRPLFEFKGRADEVPVMVADETGAALAAQPITTENDCDPDLPWRKRVVVPLELPPFGWRLLHLGLAPKKDGAKKTRAGADRARATGSHAITNGLVSISAPPGEMRVGFRRRKSAWLPEGLQVRLYADEWGAWGGMGEEEDSWRLTRELERWRVTMAQVLEDGPERAVLWARFEGARSRLDLRIGLESGSERVEIEARAFLDERAARLKLVFPAGGPADYAVPGGEIRRAPCGEVPGVRWVRAGAGANRLGFASDSLHGFDTTDDEFRASVARASRYAGEIRRRADETPWAPVMDQGELRFRFLLTPDCEGLERLAAELEEPPVVMPVPARAGRASPAVPVLELSSPACELLALRARGPRDFELRLRNAGPARSLAARWLGRRLALGRVGGGEIATWRIRRGAGAWSAKRASAV